MAQKEVKQWITVNGKHIPIFEGESKEDAVKRVTKGSKRDKIDDGFKEIKNTHKKYEDMSDKELDDVLADEKYWSDKTEHEYEIAENIQARKKRENSKSKLSKQISKDNDEKEKQIKQNENERKRLNSATPRPRLSQEELRKRAQENAKNRPKKTKVNITPEAQKVGRSLYNYMVDNDVSSGSKKWHEFIEKAYAKTDKSMTLEEFKRAVSFISIHQ